MDTVVFPFRESFAAIFFVTLGTILDPALILAEPLLLSVGLFGVVVLKTMAAAVALRVVGLNWIASIGMGLGLAQLGEFSFLLLAQGSGQGLITDAVYNRLLFIALTSLILTPELLKFGLRWARRESMLATSFELDTIDVHSNRLALVIGIGLIGRQVASRLETLGIDVRLIDQSPINLHAFAQHGFYGIAGDARDPMVLQRARAEKCRLAIVCVPDDVATLQVVRQIRKLNRSATLIARCRYQGNLGRIRNAGADVVICEEVEASSVILASCERLVDQDDSANR